jgi:hypothetical protein
MAHQREDRRFVSDEEQIEEIELTEASLALADAEANWYKLHHGTQKITVAHWEALEARYQADKRLWKLFTQGDRSLNSAYNSYRERLLKQHDPEA